MARVVVLGVGNVLTGDDAFGPTVVRTLEAGWEVGDGVEVLDAGTPGMDLAVMIGDAEALIVVDTVASDGPPGCLHLYDRDALVSRPLAPRVNPHAPGLKETLLSLEMGEGGPADVLLVGVVPSATDVGVGLSEPLKAAVPRALRVVLEALAALGVPIRTRPDPPPPDLWWESAARGAFLRGSGQA